jgi:hypothetical protein
VDALGACHLTNWDSVIKAMLDVLIKDEKVGVKGKIADVIFSEDSEREVQMEGMYALKMWIRHRDVATKLSCLDKVVELKLCNKGNMIVMGEYLKDLFRDEDPMVRARALDSMLAGELVGEYLETELVDYYDILIDLLQYDSDNDVKILAAQCLLYNTTTTTRSCTDVTSIIGGWVQSLTRQDLFLPAVRCSLFVPSEYWMNVDLAKGSSKFKSFNITSSLSVQAIMKLLDNDVELGKVKLWVMCFVLHLAEEGFSLRLLSTLLDSVNYRRLDDILSQSSTSDDCNSVELLRVCLDVMLSVFVKDQTEMSLELQDRVQKLLKFHPDLEIRGRCADLVMKFDMSTENIVTMVTAEGEPELQGVALKSILAHKECLLRQMELMDVILGHVVRMGSANLILTLEILRELELNLFDDKHLNVIRSMLVALMGRILLEFDTLHDKEVVAGRLGNLEESDMHLSEWCIPAINVVEKHTFLLQAVSMNTLNEEKRRLSAGIANMSFSAAAMAQAEEDGRRKSLVAGASTVVASKRLTETLMKLAQHDHAEPETLKKVCGIFVSSIREGELSGLSGLVDAVLKCQEPEMGVILLQTLESVEIQDEESVKPLLKMIMGDPKTRGFCFKPLNIFLEKMRAQEECEWVLPKSWSDLVAKGMKDKVIEMAFLMKELRVGGMVSGSMFKKLGDMGAEERTTYTGIMFEPVPATEL